MTRKFRTFQRASFCMLGLVAILGLVLFSATPVKATVVADENFEGDVDAYGPGNGTNQNPNGPPTPDFPVPGEWIPNGYNHAGSTDPNPNLGAAYIAHVSNGPFAPSVHAVKAVDDSFGYMRSEGASHASQGGILAFTDTVGTQVSANTNDKIVGEFQIWLEGGNFQFALVSDISTLIAEQTAHSWNGTTSAGDTPINAGSPVDMPSAYTGGDYYEGIGGLITHKPGSNNETHAVIENLGIPGQLIPTKLEDDIAKSYGAFPANSQWQKISFEYTVGSEFWDNLSVTRYDDNTFTTSTTEELRVLSGGSAVPFSAAGNAPGQIEAIVFGAGDGSTVRWFLDEIHIEVTAGIPEPASMLLMLLGLTSACFARNRR
jgi:hypothetical protein